MARVRATAKRLKAARVAHPLFVGFIILSLVPTFRGIGLDVGCQAASPRGLPIVSESMATVPTPVERESPLAMQRTEGLGDWLSVLTELGELPNRILRPDDQPPRPGWLPSNIRLPLRAATPPSAILITHDADFSDQGWPGNGTVEDPYRIENQHIDRGGVDGHCIEVRNTTVYFQIKGCVLEGATNGSAIVLGNVTNGQILGNTFANNLFAISIGFTNACIIRNNTVTGLMVGIHVYESELAQIKDNVCQDTWLGIWLSHSTSCQIVHNTCIPPETGIGVRIESSNSSSFVDNTVPSAPGAAPWSWDCGFLLETCTNNTLTNNTCSDVVWGFYFSRGFNNTIVGNSLTHCGFIVWGSLPQCRQTQVNGNTVNGRPLLYWVDRFGETVPGQAGQVLLINCTSVVVQHQNLSRCGIGIALQYSSYNTLAHNLCNDNDYRGIRLMLSSHHNTLVNNTCNYSGQSGLEVSESTFNMIANSSCNGNYADGLSLGANNNTLANNTCLQNGMSGIGLWRAYGNLIANNTCSDNEHGIELDDSDFNTLDYNRCRDNYWYNINLFGACDNVVTRNTLTGSQWGCYVTRWSANKIANNAFLGCGIYLDLFWAATYCTIPSFPKTLFVNNTVNGKALVVWQDKAEASLIEDAGQVILINCSHVTVQDQVLNNTTIGIHLIKCREITVTNNTCRHNTIWGLYLTDANATLATHNTFGPNELSVHLEAAWYIHTEEPPVFLRGNWNNSFLWNSFVDNSWHGALDHGAETVFDRNYWSDYTGKDLNDDGYGDTPYEVPNGNADAHPLMLPPGLVIWRQLPVGQVVFLNSPFRYDLNASAAPPGLATWWLNDTRLFAINHAGVVTNSTTLDLGVYPLRVSVNDTYGNTLTAAFTVTVVPRTQPRQPTDILPTVVLVVVAAAFLAAVSYGIVSDWRHQRRLRGPA